MDGIRSDGPREFWVLTAMAWLVRLRLAISGSAKSDKQANARSRFPARNKNASKANIIA